MRNKIIRVLTIPFVLFGVLWYHIEKAFNFGYSWESINHINSYKCKQEQIKDRQ